MRNRVVLACIAVCMLAAGCGGQRAATHPLTNELEPAYAELDLKTFAALPFASDIGETEDPDKLAASLCESKFYRGLHTGSGFTFLGSDEVSRTLEQQDLTSKLQKFYKNWISDQVDVDADFIKKVASAMKTDGVVAGAVDVWHQQPVDITQTGTARTTVGLLVGVFDGKTGKRLWLGRDENFKEAVRYTAPEQSSELGRTQTAREMERSNLRTATGVYAPPDFTDVVDLVVAPLVTAFPKPKR